MKKNFCIFLSLLLLLSLAGCGSKNWSGTHQAEIVVADYGTITVELDGDAAPLSTANFLTLAKKGFYDGTSFYRVLPDFGIYGGDPNRNGTGTSGSTVQGEFSANGWNNVLSNTRCAIGMARGTHYDSASCQFYILKTDATYLDGDFAVFGYVISGMDVVEAICSSVSGNEDDYVSTGNQPVITEINVLN